MSKRKIDINQIKKLSVKGRNSSKPAKYETVLSLFKQKEGKEGEMFAVRFPTLVRELLETLASYQLFSKIGTKEQIKPINLSLPQILLDSLFQLKGLSSEYPIRELISCLYVRKMECSKKPSVMLGIQDHKLILFFKKIRDIYEEFCIGDKLLLQPSEYTAFYEAFKSEWTRKQQKGRETNLERLEKRLVRCLFVFIVLVENNILSTLEEREKKQQRESSEVGTKSQQKNIVKHNSLTNSINSLEMISNFSVKPMSQHSHGQLEVLNKEYSQKSEKVNMTNKRMTLFDKAEIGYIKFRIETTPLFPDQDGLLSAPFINLLEDGVENVLIEESFRLEGRRRKLSDELDSNQGIFLRAYVPTVADTLYMNHHMYNYSPNYAHGYNHNYSQGFIPVPIQMPLVNMNMGLSYGSEDMELHQLRRSMDVFSPFPVGVNINKVRSQIVKPKTPRPSNKSNK